MIIDFLKNTYKVNFGFQITRPHIVCKDGFTMSVQAGIGLYCSPQKNLENGKYESVEVGYPNDIEDLLIEFAEDCDYTNTVYPYVPVETVDKIILKHGGIKSTIAPRRVTKK